MNELRPIIDLKKGLVGTVLSILFLVVLEGFLLYWCFFRDWYVLPFALIGGVLSLILGYGVIQNFGKTAFLALDGNDLVWAIKMRNSPDAVMTRIPLHSLRTIEFVFPKEHKRQWYAGGAEQNWKVFLTDVHGTRHQIPKDLYPDAYRNKIIVALHDANPAIKVVSNGLPTHGHLLCNIF